MNPKMVYVALKRIEQSLEKLDIPATCSADFFGDLRSVSPTAKVRELEALAKRLVECQQWATTEGQIDWIGRLRVQISEKLNIIFHNQSNIVFDELTV